jgi:hypothetical protein
VKRLLNCRRPLWTQRAIEAFTLRPQFIAEDFIGFLWHAPTESQKEDYK